MAILSTEIKIYRCKSLFKTKSQKIFAKIKQIISIEFLDNEEITFLDNNKILYV